MKSDFAVIGLFQGMFEENILTFNPGWDNAAQNLEEFTDVREIQKVLKEKGISLTRKPMNPPQVRNISSWKIRMEM